MEFNGLKLEENVKVELIGTHNNISVSNLLFKWSRRSIYEGIFESSLAEKASCSMHNGNTYKLHINDTIMYVHCDGEYACFGTSIEHK